MAKPLYETLGAKESDDAETIKRRYRRRSKQCHPDKRPNDPDAVEEFKALAQAFEVLSDPQKRIEYDRTGQIPKPGEDPRAKALAVLGSLLHSILANDIQTGRKTTDRALIADMKGALTEAITKGEETLTKMRKQQATLEEVASRFTPPDGEENVMAAIARAPVMQIQATIRQAEIELKAHKDAFGIVKKFKFRKDKSTPTETRTVWVQFSGT